MFDAYDYILVQSVQFEAKFLRMICLHLFKWCKRPTWRYKKLHYLKNYRNHKILNLFRVIPHVCITTRSKNLVFLINET